MYGNKGQAEARDGGVRKRLTQSCDRCKLKKRRCDGQMPCSNCLKAKEPCTMAYEQKKRGPKNAGDDRRKRRQSTASFQSLLDCALHANVHPSFPFPPGFASHPRPAPYTPANPTSAPESTPGLLPTSFDRQFSSPVSYQPDTPPTQSSTHKLYPNDHHRKNPHAPTPHQQTGSSILDFDCNFPSNLALDANLQRANQKINQSPDAKLVTPGETPQQNGFSLHLESINNTLLDASAQGLQIDREVLNLYAQLNPKIATNLSGFINSTLGFHQSSSSAIGTLSEAPVDLSIPEFSLLQSDFFLHLIAMFFTYYHPTMPLLNEELFFQHLIPRNSHHPMLLNAMYSIGCRYSKHPALFRPPLSSPSNASEYFLDKAYADVPPCDDQFFVSASSLDICQASILLAMSDFSMKNGRSWMMINKACRLAQSYEVYNTESRPDFISLYTGKPKIHMNISPMDRKRVWWSALMADLFATLSTGKPLLISEAEYLDTMVDTTTLIKHSAPKMSYADKSLGKSSGQITVHLNSIAPDDTQKWRPFFNGFPKDSLFGLQESMRWNRTATGFYNVDHLFSNMEDSVHLLQLSFLVRRIVRMANVPTISSAGNSPFMARFTALSNHNVDVVRLHESLLIWYENLPTPFRFFHSLEALTTNNPDDMTKFCTAQEGTHINGSIILLNLLFFSAYAILHQRSAEVTAMSFDDVDDPNMSMSSTLALPPSGISINQVKSSQPMFAISSSLLSRGMFESQQILGFIYKAQCHLLRTVYGPNVTPTKTCIPPAEMVAMPIMGMLIMPIAVALLGQTAYARRLVQQKQAPSGDGVDGNHLAGIEPLESLILPVLDNIAQVWPSNSDRAATLRSLIEKTQKRLSASNGSALNTNAPMHRSSDGWNQVFQSRQETAQPTAFMEALKRNDAAAMNPPKPQLSGISATTSFMESLLQPGVASSQPIDQSLNNGEYSQNQQSFGAARSSSQQTLHKDVMVRSNEQMNPNFYQHNMLGRTPSLSWSIQYQSSQPLIEPIVSAVMSQQPGGPLRGSDSSKQFGAVDLDNFNPRSGHVMECYREIQTHFENEHLL